MPSSTCVVSHDFASDVHCSSIKDFSNKFLDSGTPLHVLINNAGMYTLTTAFTLLGSTFGTQSKKQYNNKFTVKQFQ